MNKLKTNVSGAFPIRKNTMPRKMSDAPMLKGLPSRALGQSGFRNSRVPMPSRCVFTSQCWIQILRL